jgi:hypothetical protein
MELIIKSFGYGIMMIETQFESASINNDMEVICSMFGCVQEWVCVPDDSHKILLVIAEGHIPTIYELRQIEAYDWKLMERMMDGDGSEVISTRIKMLEIHIKEYPEIHRNLWS